VSPLPAVLFESPLPGLHRPLSRSEGAKIGKYLLLLRKWQKTHRLVGSVELTWVVENLFIDSLCFLEALPQDSRTVADVGSGAGIPGVPIAIVRPDLRVTLIEARARRVSFLSTVKRELALNNVEILAQRSESLRPPYPGSFDAAVMRCAGKIDVILPHALRLVRHGGTVVAAAGPSAQIPPGAEAVVVRIPSGSVRTLYRLSKP